MCRKKSAISLFPHQAHTSFCPWHSFNMLFWTTFYFSCLCYFCIKIARFIDRSEFIHLNETNLNHNTTSERRKKAPAPFVRGDASIIFHYYYSIDRTKSWSTKAVVFLVFGFEIGFCHDIACHSLVKGTDNSVTHILHRRYVCMLTLFFCIWFINWKKRQDKIVNEKNPCIC